MNTRRANAARAQRETSTGESDAIAGTAARRAPLHRLSAHRTAVALVAALLAVAGAASGAGADAPAADRRERDPNAASVLLQVEDMEGPWRSQTNITGYIGKGFKTSNANGICKTPMRGKAVLSKAGKYAVWARAYEGSGDRRFKLKIGDKLLPSTHKGKGANIFTWQRAGVLDLPEGEIAVEVWDDGTGFETADAILLTTDLRYDPGWEHRHLTVMTTDEIIKQEAAYIGRMARPRFMKCTTTAAWRARSAVVRRHVLDCLALWPLPERLPPDIKWGGSLERNGVRVSRIYWQAWPDVYASGFLFVRQDPPLGGMAPGVLGPHGHWREGLKAAPVQMRLENLALKGYVVLGVDSVHIYDYAAGIQPLTAMLWGCIRGLDVLSAWPGVDPTRIGVMGHSGGGQQTCYVMTADDRPSAAVISGMSQQLCDILAPVSCHCDCNHVAGQFAETDMPEMIATAAPKPVRHLIMNDWTVRFDTAGFPDILGVYRIFGAAGVTDYRRHGTPHECGKPKREQIYEWFNRHLMGIDDPESWREEQFEPWSVEELTKLDNPSVATLRSASHKVLRIMVEETLKRRASKIPTAQDEAAMTEYLDGLPGRLRLLLREDTVADVPLAPEVRDRLEYCGYELLKLTFASEEDARLPALLLRRRGLPAGGKAFVVLVTGGKHNAFFKETFESLKPLLDAGAALLLVDLRTTGEFTKVAKAQRLNGLYFGRSSLPLMTHDALRSARLLREWSEVGAKQVGLAAWDGNAAPALVAAALDQSIAPVAVLGVGRTYRCGNREPTAPHLLTVCDVEQAAGAVAPRRLWLGGLSPEEAADWPRAAYALRSAGGKLRIAEPKPGELVKWLLAD